MRATSEFNYIAWLLPVLCVRIKLPLHGLRGILLAMRKRNAGSDLFIPESFVPSRCTSVIKSPLCKETSIQSSDLRSTNFAFVKVALQRRLKKKPSVQILNEHVNRETVLPRKFYTSH